MPDDKDNDANESGEELEGEVIGELIKLTKVGSNGCHSGPDRQ